MKTRILIIVFSRLMLDISPALQAQDANRVLAKDSFTSFVSEVADRTSGDSAIEPHGDAFSSNLDTPTDEAGVLLRMTAEVRMNLEVQRVRVVSSEESANSKESGRSGRCEKKKKF